MTRFNLAITALILIFTLQEGAFAFSRPEDHVILKGSLFDHIKGRQINNIRVFAFKKGEPVAIPFQIDKLNVDGDYLFNIADEKEKTEKRKEAYEDALDEEDISEKKLKELKRRAEWIENPDIFDAEDEMVFMAMDLGEKSGGRPISDALVIEEIKITNPIDDDTGYAYAAFYKDNPPPLSLRKYVNYDPDKDEVYAEQYVLKTEKERPFVFREAMPRFADGRVGENQIDYSWTQVKLDIKYFLTLNFDDNNIKGKIVAYMIGPVRVIKRMLCWMQVAFIRVTPRFTMDMIFYPNGIIAPGVIECPFVPERILNPGSKITIKQDFNDCMIGAKIYTAKSGEAAVIDGKMSNAEKAMNIKDHKWYVVYTEKDGSIFIQIEWDKSLDDIKTDIVYIDDKDILTDHEDTPGTHTVGFSSDILQFPKGRYMMYINVYLDRTWEVGREKRYINIIANPLKAHIEPIKKPD